MSTYNQLVSALESWMENPSDEFVAAIPTMVSMAEARMCRDINVNALDYEVSGTMTAGVPYVPMPDDLIQPRHLRIFDGTRSRILQMKELEYMLEFAPNDTETGTPVYYGISSGTQYRIAPVPSSSYPYTLAYKRTLPKLSNDNQSNWFTTHAYDALFAACMCEAGRFVLDDRQQSIIALWEQKYQMLVAAINGVDVRSERDDFRSAPIQNDNR